MRIVRLVLPTFVVITILLMTLAGCGGGSSVKGSGGNTPTLSSIAVTPATASIAVGATQQLAATGTYSDGSTKNLSASAAWSSSMTSVATVSTVGLATGVTAGQTTITATVSGVSGSAVLTITSPIAALTIQETIAGQTTTLGGATVVVDGLAVGHIGDDGAFSIQEQPGIHQLQVLDAGAAGIGTITVTGGSPQSIAIDVTDTEATDVPSTSTVGQVVSGVVNLNDPTANPLVVQIADVSGHAVSLVSPSAFLTNSNGIDTDLSAYTTVGAGGAISIDLDAAVAAGGGAADFVEGSPYQLTIFGNTSEGYPFNAVTAFEAGVYPLTGHVTAPPSSPTLPVAGGSLMLTKHSSSVSYSVTVGGDGSFSLSGVPPGQYNVSGSFSGANGITYNVFGTSSISSAATLAIVPLGPADIAAGVVSVTTTSGSATQSPAMSGHRSPARRSDTQIPLKKADVTLPSSSPYGPEITVAAAAQNAVQQASQLYTIPSGIKTADVLYQVCSEEYPEYVDAQSQYNDVWSATAVDGIGTQLVNAADSVNEMLFEAPTWLSNGCTTVIDTPATFSSSTAPNTITIAVTSVDIGDGVLPTTVSAIVVPSSSFTIKSFTLDPFTMTPTALCANPSSVSSDTSNIAVCLPSKGNFLSVPVVGSSDGTTNTFHRPATAKLQFEANNPVTVTNVELDMVDISGNVIDTLFNGPLGGSVSQPAPDTLKLDLTYNSGTKASGITDVSVIPDQISFNLIVTGTQNGASGTAQNNSFVFNSLVPATANSIVAGIGRYPKDPLGGGDWATNDTVSWMQVNADLLNRFNDISGEHGRNVGHKTHNSGTAIDIFQFDPLSTASGKANYNALAQLANKAATGDGVAQTQVASWVTMNRSGLDALFNAGSVAKIYCGLGSATTNLPANWEKIILMTGMLPTAQGTSIDLGVGTWTPAGSVTCIPGHESHHHIQLSF